MTARNVTSVSCCEELTNDNHPTQQFDLALQGCLLFVLVLMQLYSLVQSHCSYNLFMGAGGIFLPNKL